MIVYRISCKTSNKAYIGITIRPLRVRWGAHKYDAYINNSNLILHRAMRKHGIESFSIEVLQKADSLEELLKLEMHYISLQNTMIPNGYNMTLGGQGPNGRLISEELRARMKQIHTGKIVSQATREKIRQAQLGRIKTPEEIKKTAQKNRGRKHTEETLARMRAAKAGKPRSKETKEKLRQARLGKKASEETRAKLRAGHVGRAERFPFKHTEETKAKLRALRLGKSTSEELKKKLSRILSGRKKSPETRARMRAARARQELAKKERLGLLVNNREEAPAT